MRRARCAVRDALGAPPALKPSRTSGPPVPRTPDLRSFFVALQLIERRVEQALQPRP